MKLYDCCMYFNEDLILDLRLNTLNVHVDEFIIAEATRDHAGNEKKLNLVIKKINEIELNCKKNHELATNITLDFLSTVCDEVNNYS